MPEFDDLRLDDQAVLSTLDHGGLLWSLATAGAQVRRAVEVYAEGAASATRTDAPPRALLVAGEESITRLTVQAAAPSCVAMTWVDPELPAWAGPADALLVAAPDGRDPRLARLTAAAQRRGLLLSVVAPAGSPVAVAAGRSPVHVPGVAGHPLAMRWSCATPLLLTLDSWGVRAVPRELLLELADGLDAQAAACRPDADVFVNPAKALAVELAEATALAVGTGPFAALAAQAFVRALARFAGVAGVWSALPADADLARALLRAVDGGEQDLFRDRLDEPAARRPRLIIIGDDGPPDDPLLGEHTAVQLQLTELAARDVVRELERTARGSGVRVSSVEVPAGDPLTRYAAASAFGEFTAAYLALGSGLDPGGLTAGEFAGTER